MNKTLMKSASLLLVVFCCAIHPAAALASGTNATALANPQSLFVDDAQGKDPFFPQSTRRMQQPLTPMSTNMPSPVVAVAPLVLKGISGSKLQPLALINNATIGIGESADVRTGAQTVKIRCRDIRDRSALIEINGTGEVRELKLREGI
jgi:hypothetical protein